MTDPRRPLPPPPPASGPIPPAPPTWPTAPPRAAPGLATASLVCGLVGLVLFFVPVLSILAIVFGGVAIARARRAPGRGDNRGRARAGLILGIVGVVAFVVVFVIGGALGWFGEDVAYTDLDVGDCVELDLEDTEVSTLPKVACTTDHQGEVYAVVPAEGDDDFPGDEALTRQAEDLCAGDLFTDYVGVEYLESTFDFYVVYPLESAWRSGERDIVCFAIRPDGRDMDSSVRSSGN